MAYRINSQASGFKEAMDCIQEDKIKLYDMDNNWHKVWLPWKANDAEEAGPEDDLSEWMVDRVKALREKWFFSDRGREKVPKPLRRRNSLGNDDAGISGAGHTPREAREFFPEEIVHAKAIFKSVPGVTKSFFQKNGFPFIG